MSNLFTRKNLMLLMGDRIRSAYLTGMAPNSPTMLTNYEKIKGNSYPAANSRNLRDLISRQSQYDFEWVLNILNSANPKATENALLRICSQLGQEMNLSASRWISASIRIGSESTRIWDQNLKSGTHTRSHCFSQICCSPLDFQWSVLFN